MMLDDQKWPEWLIQFPPFAASEIQTIESVDQESQVRRTNPLRKVNREHSHFGTQQLAAVAIDLVSCLILDSWVFAT